MGFGVPIMSEFATLCFDSSLPMIGEPHLRLKLMDSARAAAQEDPDVLASVLLAVPEQQKGRCE